MSKVFFSVGMSLDGFIAGPNRGPKNPLGDHGVKMHEWAFRQRAFRETLKLGEGGETGADNRIVEAILKRTGASIMGRRMFEEGEQNWPEEAGDTVATLGHYTATNKSTGKPLNAQFVHVWWLRDGKIVPFQQYTDTAQFARVTGVWR